MNDGREEEKGKKMREAGKKGGNYLVVGRNTEKGNKMKEAGKEGRGKKGREKER